MLALRQAQAQARDAVHTALDAPRLERDVGPLLWAHSAAHDRAEYLLRPDLGRRLGDGMSLPAGKHDLVLVLVDGLSARAVQDHAPAMVAALRPGLAGWRLAPVVAVRQGRVAVGDAVAQAIGASAVVVLIGERPGLSAADSMSAYLTWRPGPTTSDADRNCISNIRPDGLPAPAAAHKVLWLLEAMRNRNLSGIALKDEAGPGHDADGRLDSDRSADLSDGVSILERS